MRLQLDSEVSQGIEIGCCAAQPSKAIWKLYQSLDPQIGKELNRELTVTPLPPSIRAQHPPQGLVLRLAKAADRAALGSELHQRVIRRGVGRPGLAAACRLTGLGKSDPAGMDQRLHGCVFGRERDAETRCERRAGGEHVRNLRPMPRARLAVARHRGDVREMIEPGRRTTGL